MRRRTFTRGLPALWVGGVLAQGPAPLEATSADGRWRFLAAPGALWVVDAGSGQRVRTWPAAALGQAPGNPVPAGQVPSSQVRSLHVLAARQSVLVAFDGLAEWWEISTNPLAEPIFDGLVHDYRMAEAIALPGFLNPRRTRLEAPLGDLVFADNPAWVVGRVIGRAPSQPDGQAVLQVWQLDVRRRIAEHRRTGNPQLLQARRLWADGRPQLAIPDAAGGPDWRIDWPPR